MTNKQLSIHMVALDGDDAEELPHHERQMRPRLVRSKRAIEVDKQRVDRDQNMDFLLRAYRIPLKENWKDRASY